jgi:hypothetical protein
LLLDNRRVYKSTNNLLVNELYIDVNPAFILLAADIERALKTERPLKDFDAILRQMQERLSFTDID